MSNDQPRTIKIWNQHWKFTWGNIHFPWFLRILNEGPYEFRDNWGQFGLSNVQAPVNQDFQTVARWKLFQCLLLKNHDHEQWDHKKDTCSWRHLCRQLLISDEPSIPLSPHGSIALTSSTTSIFWQAPHPRINLFETVSLLPWISKWECFPASVLLAASVSYFRDIFSTLFWPADHPWQWAANKAQMWRREWWVTTLLAASCQNQLFPPYNPHLLWEPTENSTGHSAESQAPGLSGAMEDLAFSYWFRIAIKT